MLAGCERAAAPAGSQNTPGLTAKQAEVSPERPQEAGTEACDGARLLSLVRKLEPLPPGDRGLPVAEQLPKLCALPLALERYLEKVSRFAHGNVTADLSGNRRPPLDGDAVLLDLCPGAPNLVPDISSLSRPERLRLYGECGFDQLDLTDENEWALGDYDSLMPQFAYVWLHRDGVSAEDARLLAMAIVDVDVPSDQALTGAEVADAFAAEAANPSTGEGTIGLGNVGLIGKGSAKKAAPEGSLRIDGVLNEPLIAKVVANEIRHVRRCFLKYYFALHGFTRKDGAIVLPKFHDPVKVRFVIGAEGTVESANVDLKSLPKHIPPSCVTKAISRCKFPAPADGKQVNVKHRFSVD